MKMYKVLHAPSSVGGNPQALSRALRQLGVQSYSLVVSQNYLAYPADMALHRPGQSLVMRELKRIGAILFMLPRFDVIHYNAGTTLANAYAFIFSSRQGARGFLRLFYACYLRILQRFEITYVRMLGKAVFVTYQGDDARQGDYSREHFAINIASQVEEGYYCAASDAFKRRNIKLLSSIAHQVYSVNPDLLHVLHEGARFTPYSLVFLDEWMPSYTQDQNRPLRIVHAPSNRKVKGSDLILSALDRLRAKGFEFELLLVEGMSNAEARKVYESADVLVDQLFAGWYGGLAVELMALGKPVLVYIRDEDLGFIPPEMKADLPFLQITPVTVEDALRDLLLMPRESLVALGKRSRAFVERWHDPLNIARDIKEDYENTQDLHVEVAK
ncbi:glycosyltransferase family 1 protein [Pseudomonas anguilliseptica]|uniref:Glycosyltransferase involved in cell wall bisynthesis n=1 Tax=Pseudomonas anguilliseptica TaxID=53406 RepID=A0A1H5IVR8_PSEAG|nr:glycosyltransferase family 1 protein [Pseudomonas anguilliseptica]SEE43528.1 Glycosyltransferase involved in cell wall bisynthesis [Pseudomonas anguilliseptica]